MLEPLIGHFLCLVYSLSNQQTRTAGAPIERFVLDGWDNKTLASPNCGRSPPSSA
jgi:hypothetical protein